MKNHKETSSYSNKPTSFFSKNKVWVAIVAGAATGIVLASLLGKDKVKKAYDTLKDTANDLTDKAREVWDNNKETLADTAENVIGKAKSTAGRARAKAEQF